MASLPPAASLSLPPAPPAQLLDIQSLPSLEKFDSQVRLHSCMLGSGRQQSPAHVSSAPSCRRHWVSTHACKAA